LETGEFRIAAGLLAGRDNPFVLASSADAGRCEHGSRVVDVSALKRRVAARLRARLKLGGTGFTDSARGQVRLVIA
jgi:hypothetical protein